MFTVDTTTGGFRAYNAATDAFNFAPFNFFQRNQERYGLGGFAHYKFNDAADVYTQLLFNDTRTNAVIAPSGVFGETVFVSPDNPLLSDLQRTQLFGTSTAPVPIAVLRRNVEGGGRDNNLRYTAYRAVFGVKGDFAKAWSYDTSIQYGATVYSQIYRNEFSLTRARRALDVVDDGAGNAVCRSVLDGTDANCLPFNVFNGQRVDPAVLNYLQVPGLQVGGTTQQVATGSIQGLLGEYGLQSPFAENGVGISFGAEYRRESAFLESDVSFQTGDLAGQGAPTLPISGAFQVKELFAEISIPLIENQPGFHKLGIEAAYRFSDYTQTSSTDTYKVSGEWAPVKDIRFRGGFNRAVRAPNIGEIINPTFVGLGVSADPCAGTANNGDATLQVGEASATAAQCAQDPLIAANPGLYGTILLNPADQYNAQFGTSPGLASERADTYTGGFVFQPTFVKDLSISLDYYSIEVNGFIGGYGGDTIIEACYERGALCNLIQRDATAGPAFGSLWIGNGGFVVNTTQNTGQLTSKGIDLAANYRLRLADLGLGSQAGTVTFDIVGTRVLEIDVTPIPGDSTSTFSCGGNFGVQCGVPSPNWRHRFRATYAVPTPALLDSQVRLSAAWRYIGHASADAATTANDLDRRIGAESYLDMSAAITFSGSYTFRVGAQNLLDNDPPIIGGPTLPPVVGNGNTFPQVYDSLGRFLYANIVLEF
ncbi:TonB-dependent receptor [Nevskia sp.]|uniref:TonB-dependent receptor n=1 Tax=Nevskia sp. TaxID=1929292 RepID=UPI0025D71FEC|nr:TonB-dependent receptor [Nevskia sp.]